MLKILIIVVAILIAVARAEIATGLREHGHDVAREGDRVASARGRGEQQHRQ